MRENRKQGIWNKNYILCMTISTVAALGHGMFNPALPVYAKGLGITTDVIGAIVAFAMFVCMFGRGIVGGMADWVNNKKLVALSLLILFSGYLCFFFAKSVPLLLIAKTLQAVGNGMTNTVLSTLAFASVPQEKLASGVGMFSLASSLAQCFAPNLGTELAYAGKFYLLFSISLGMTVISLLILPLLQPCQQIIHKEKSKLSIKEFVCKPAVPAAIMLLFNGIVYSSLANYLSLYGMERNLERIGIFFTINSVTMLVTRPLTGKICDSRPLEVIMIPGYIAQIATFLLLSNAGTMWSVCIAAACFGFGFGSTQAAIQIMALRSVGPEMRGRANGTFYVGGDIGLSAGAYAAGGLARYAGYSKLYLIMSMVAGCCLIFFLVYRKKTIQNRESEE